MRGLFLVLLLASCTKPAARALPRGAPARVLVVSESRFSLRASAYVELHCLLASAARIDGPVAAELDTAKRAYTRAAPKDLAAAARALATCTDDRCAQAAVSPYGFGYAYERALEPFVAREWRERSAIAWRALEVGQASLVPEVEPLVTRIARDLAVEWQEPLPVAFATEVPAVGIAPLAVPARGECVARGTPGLDCLLVQGLVAKESPLRDKLRRELGDHAGERAWEVLVVHTVSAVLTSWRPAHRSAYRRFAAAEEGEAVRWLAENWQTNALFFDAYWNFWRSSHASE